jgi:hypothetical protein
MFRGEATPVIWPANVGDQMVFTGVGLITPSMRPRVPGVEIEAASYTKEQWTAQLNSYSGSIDSHMPTSITMIANLFLRNSQQLGLSASTALNRLTRDRLYNAGLSGMTVTDGAQTTVTVLAVKRLNGLTRARRPDLAAGSPVLFSPVSSTNPLVVTILTTTGAVTRNVTAFAPTTPGDEVGPGTITVNSAVTVNDRAYVIASDATSIVRLGAGGLQVDSLDSTSLLRLQDIRTGASRLQNMNVPEMEMNKFHLHIDPVQKGQFFADPEVQRLFTALPDHYFYKDYSLGEIMGVVVFVNNECPQTFNVAGGTTATFTQDDPFAGEMWTNGATTGIKVHRGIMIGADAIYEYYQDLAALLTEAGVTGKVGTWSITNNGIEVNADRIQMIIRAPLNKTQDEVSTTWQFKGDWPVRTDAATGDAARYKRMVVLEGAE